MTMRPSTSGPHGSPPPQLLKWVGNKQRVATQIVRYFPGKFGTYFEPFLGSGAVLGAVAPNHGMASDVLEPLIDIWQAVVDDPEGLVAAYDRWRSQVKMGRDPREVYEEARTEFNQHRRGGDFLYLSRACYGGGDTIQEERWSHVYACRVTHADLNGVYSTVVQHCYVIPVVLALSTGLVL